MTFQSQATRITTWALALTTIFVNEANAFFTIGNPKPVKSPIKSKSPMFEYLKFDGEPKFDVLEKTKDYVETLSLGVTNDDLYAEDYVLRGPVIGPISRKDLTNTQTRLGIIGAFPDLKWDTFGYTIDPENPYRCFYFQRWRGTHSNDMNVFNLINLPATGTEMETPVSVFTVVFNPEGRIVYEQVGAVVDRHEGNTQGKAAVFGMLDIAGLKLSANPGDKVFALIQRLGNLADGLGRSWSREEDIPDWWITKSKGADGNDVDV